MEFSKSTFLHIIHYIIMVDSLLQKTQGQSSCSGETDRFINGMCYTFYNETLTWQDAKIRCEERGKVLAAVNSMIQIKEMLFRQGITTQVWIGANDIAEEGKFVWVHNNQTAVELAKLWEENEPNDLGNEDCVVFFLNFETNDVPCDYDYPYFCMETPKKDSEDEKPILSLQNIYIISAAGAAFLLLVLALACVIFCRRKGKRLQPIKRHPLYDSYPEERHDVVAYTTSGYAPLKSMSKPDEKESPLSKDENQYDYIGGETTPEQDCRFYGNVATFHQTKPKEIH